MEVKTPNKEIGSFWVHWAKKKKKKRCSKESIPNHHYNKVDGWCELYLARSI